MRNDETENCLPGKSCLLNKFTYYCPAPNFETTDHHLNAFHTHVKTLLFFSVLSHYQWMYIVPLVLFLMMSGAQDQSGGGGGGGAANGGGR